MFMDNAVSCLLIVIILFIVPTNSNLLFGFRGKDCVSLTSSTRYDNHGINYKSSHKWIRKLGDSVLVGVCGEGHDCELVFNELEEMSLRHEVLYDKPMSPQETAEICVQFLLKNQLQLKLNFLIGGWDEYSKEMKLFWIDYLGCLKEVPYGAHGEDSPFMLSLLDHQNNPFDEKANLGLKEVTPDQVTTHVENCWNCVRKRSMRDYSNYQVELITKSL